MYRDYLESPVGKFCIEADDEGVTALYIATDEQLKESSTDLLSKTKAQLLEYFAGRRQQFDIPFHLKGTEFQIKVWNALLEIPYGKTCCYGDIAIKTGNPKASRAVGGAVNKNPIMIIVPCHRVIGKDGNLVGFAAGLEVKKKLLETENYL